jgi:hypothetical protein
MKKWFVILVSLFFCTTLVLAKEVHSDKEIKEDIARHRAIAAAHEAAAKCLESGKKEDICFKELRDSCKGLAIGKFCGMKHEH